MKKKSYIKKPVRKPDEGTTGTGNKKLLNEIKPPKKK